jgi:hypothetical protein
MTFQLNPAWKTHLVICASQRSSPMAASSAAGFDLCSAISASSATGPPLRCAARA